jgi:hypothetical protein
MLSFKVLTFTRRRLLLDLLRRHAVAPRGLVLQQQLLQAQLAVVVGLPAAWRHAVLLAACELLGGNVRGGFQVLLLCVFGNAQEGSVTAQQGKIRFTANSRGPLYSTRGRDQETPRTKIMSTEVHLRCKSMVLRA